MNDFTFPENDAPKSLDELLNDAAPLSTSNNTDDLVKRAAMAIKEGDKERAKMLVASALQQNQTSADAWYLYAYLTDDRLKRQQALSKALAINPQHQRARQLMQTTSNDDPFESILPHFGSGVSQPIINVHIAQNNANSAFANSMAIAGGGATPHVNQTALLLGIIFAFFGIFGVAHLVTGKIAGALGQFLLGFCWLFVAFVVTTLTGGIGACLTLPMHLVLCYSISKRGATVML